MIALLLAAAAGCGSTEQESNDSTPGLIAGGVTRAELLAELDALQPEGNTPAAEFDGLKSALKQALQIAPSEKFTVHPPQGPNSAVTDLTLAIMPDGSSGIQWTYVNPGDYNFDGQTNLHDLVNLGAFLGAVQGDERWDRAQHVDGDGNGAITIADITPIAANFLGTVTAYCIYGSASGEGGWETVSQLPRSQGMSAQPGVPPLITVPVPESTYSTFKVCALDPNGLAGEESAPSLDFILNPNVRFVSSLESADLLVVSREGMALEILAQGESSIAAGDILWNADAVDGFVLRAEEVVAAGESFKVQCAESSLTDVIKQGVVSIVEPLGLHSTWGFPRLQQIVGPEHEIASQGAYSLFGPRISIQMCFNPTGVAYAKAAVELDEIKVDDLMLLISGKYDGSLSEWWLPGNDRTLQTLTREDDLVLASGLKLPLRISLVNTLGLTGEGSFDGQYRPRFFANIENVAVDLQYDGVNKLWSPGATLPTPWLGNPTMSLQGSGDFTVSPFIGTKIALEFFPTGDATQPIDDLNLTMTTRLAQQNTYVTDPYIYYEHLQTCQLSSALAADFAELGIASLAPGAESASETSSRQGTTPWVSHPPQQYAVLGTITDGFEHAPLSGVTVRLLEQGSLNQLQITQTDENGQYGFVVEAGTAVRVVPEMEMMAFTPSWAEFTVNSELGQDFTGYWGSL